MDPEECPVCWRGFCPTVIPVCFNCGHSCCQDCSGAIRSCPLCRYRITANHPRNPNYALISLIEKVAATTTRPQALDQSCQTDIVEGPALPIIKAIPARQRKNYMDGRSMTLAIKRGGIEVSFK